MPPAALELLTPTEVRKNLTRVLNRVASGGQLGIVYRNQVFTLRPTAVVAADSGEGFGIPDSQMRRIAKSLHARAAQETRKGRSVRWTGNIKDLVRNRV